MEFNIHTIARKSLSNLQPYSTARDEYKGTASVYLDANENPFKTAYNRYPDPNQTNLKETIATLNHVNRNQIVLGNGSDEIIDLLFRAFCEPGVDNVIIPQPTYGMYSVCAQINNIQVKHSALTNEFDIDTNSIIQLIDQQTKLIFLCSPNNPTGNLLSKEKVITLLHTFQGLLIIDEAYIDFTEDKGFLSHLHEFPNLVVLQTFSKAWGLAGLRLGVGYGNSEIIQLLSRIKPPYNINTITQEIACSYLSNKDVKAKWVSKLVTERKKLEIAFAQLDCILKVYPSSANFLLVKVKDANKLYKHLLQQKVIVRNRSNVALCEGCLRITVGTANENEIVLEALTNYEKSSIY